MSRDAAVCATNPGRGSRQEQGDGYSVYPPKKGKMIMTM